MAKKIRKSNRGFTLLEVLVAMAVGLIMVAAAVQLFTKSLAATDLVSQRAEMQQDARAAENILTRDISMAGAGLPPGGVALATGGSGSNPIYGCDQTKCYLGGSPATGAAFPGGSSPYMYWIVPGDGIGPVVFTGQPATDVITIVQADSTYQLPWADYTMSLNSTGKVGTVSYVGTGAETAHRLVSDSAYGLKTGDLVLLTGKSGGNTVNAVGEVTANVTGTGAPYTVNFNTPDALGFNKSTATSNAMLQLKSLTNITFTRIWMITYFISTSSGVPTLMRQVNGQTPAPVAENVIDLQFNYDTYDDDGNLTNTTAPTSPNLIRKVNVAHLAVRSMIRGTAGYQTMDIQTSVSARNMSFSNRYQ